MSVRGYLLGIDWAGLNDPASPGEDDTSDLTPDPITVTWGRDSSLAATQPAAQQMDFVLTNSDRRYSPENTTSPLAGHVLPNRAVQLQHVDTTGNLAILFDGVLDSFSVDPNTLEFTGSCLDNWGRPSGEALSTAVFQGIRTGDAVNIILDAIGWPPDARDVDPGATVMPFWWEEGTDAATAIGRLCDSEGPPSIAYVRAGVFVFEDRFHRVLSATSQVSQGLYTYIIPAGSGPAGDFKMLKGSISYDHGLTRIVNSVTFQTDERRVANPAVVWSSDNPVVIPGGGSVTLFVSTTDPFVNAVIPLEGAGIDSDTGIVVASLSRTSGASTILTLSAAANTVVSRVQLTAQSIPVARSVKATSRDVSSIGTYGVKLWDSQRSPVWANRYDAQAIADRIVAAYALNRPLMTFTVQSLDDSYMSQVHARQISDRITVRDDQLGVNRDFFVEKIQHTVQRLDPRQHQMTLACEVTGPVPPTIDNVFLFDTAGHGFGQGAFGVTGTDNAANVLIFDAPAQSVMPLDGSFRFGHPDTTPSWSTTGCTFTAAPPGPFYGNAAQLTVVGSPTQAFARTPDSLPIIGGATYGISMFVQVQSGTVPNVRISVDWFDAAGVYISTGQSVPDITADIFGDLVSSGLLVAPINAATGRMGPTIGASPAAGTTIYVRSFTFVRAANGFDTGVFGT